MLLNSDTIKKMMGHKEVAVTVGKGTSSCVSKLPNKRIEALHLNLDKERVVKVQFRGFSRAKFSIANVKI